MGRGRDSPANHGVQSQRDRNMGRSDRNRQVLLGAASRGTRGRSLHVEAARLLGRQLPRPHQRQSQRGRQRQRRHRARSGARMGRGRPRHAGARVAKHLQPLGRIRPPIVPDQAFIDAQARALFHYYFECVAIDRMNKWVIAKPFITEHSPRFGKDYMKYPRIRLSTGTVKMGTVQFALPSSNLRESYEEKRRKYMDAYYRDLRDSLVMGAAQGGDVPIWAWRAIVDLRSRLASDTELAGVLQVSREWTNKLLARARVALKRPA